MLPLASVGQKYRNECFLLIRSPFSLESPNVYRLNNKQSSHQLSNRKRSIENICAVVLAMKGYPTNLTNY